MAITATHHLRQAIHPRELYNSLLKGLLQDAIALNPLNPNLTVWEDEFLGDALRGQWTTSNSGGTAPTTPTSGIIDGVVDLTTSATINNWMMLLLDYQNFRADRDCTILARVQLDVITTVKVEIGFRQNINLGAVGAEPGLILNLGTPTVNYNDGVCAIFDTATDTDWQLAGAEGGTAWSVADIDVAPVAATYQWIGVTVRKREALDDAYAFLEINGIRRGSIQIANAVDVTVALEPYIFVQNRSAAAHRLRIDKVILYQQKDVSA